MSGQTPQDDRAPSALEMLRDYYDRDAHDNDLIAIIISAFAEEDAIRAARPMTPKPEEVEQRCDGCGKRHLLLIPMDRACAARPSPAQPPRELIENALEVRMHERGLRRGYTKDELRDLLPKWADARRDYADAMLALFAAGPQNGAGTDLEEIASDAFMQAALDRDGRPFPPFGMRSRDDDMKLSGAQLFQAAVLARLREGA